MITGVGDFLRQYPAVENAGGRWNTFLVARAHDFCSSVRPYTFLFCSNQTPCNPLNAFDRRTE
jgi:hypothetical protein